MSHIQVLLRSFRLEGRTGRRQCLASRAGGFLLGGRSLPDSCAPYHGAAAQVVDHGARVGPDEDTNCLAVVVTAKALA